MHRLHIQRQKEREEMRDKEMTALDRLRQGKPPPEDDLSAAGQIHFVQNPTHTGTSVGRNTRAIQQGVFHEDDYPKVSVKKAQELMLGHKSQGKRACGCKSNQPCSSGKCLCFKNNRTCHSGCKCGSSCCNPNK